MKFLSDILIKAGLVVEGSTKVATVSGGLIVGGTTDAGFKADVVGTARVQNRLTLTHDIYFPNNNTDGIVITGASVVYPKIIIGGENTISGNTNLVFGKGNTSTGLGFVFGNSNTANSNTSMIFGVANQANSSGQYTVLIGGNNITSHGVGTFTGMFAIGNANTLAHQASSILGSNQTTTGNNQLIIASSQSNVNSAGFNDIYFGTGPRSKNTNLLGSNITINGSGAGAGTDLSGGNVTIAGGKGTGAGTPGDVIISTASTTTSGTTLQSLTQRFKIAATTGDVTVSVLAGTGTRMVVADSSGVLTTQSIPTGNITGTGTSGQVAYFNGSTSITSSSGLVFDGTNLGIGLAAPAQKLTVNGDVSIATILNATTDTDKFLVSDGGIIKYRTGSEVLSDIGAQGSLTLTTTGTSGAATLVGATLNIPQYQAVLTNPVTGTGTTGQVAYWSGTNTQTGSNNLFWDATNSRLGIGTTNPAYNLHLVSSSTSVAAFRNSAAAIGQILVGNTVSDLAIRILASGDSLIFSDTGKYLAFGSNGATERMRLDASGNLGIGTTTTTSAFSGSAKVLAILDNNTSNVASVRVYGGASVTSLELYAAGSQVGLYGSTNHPMIFSTNATERMRLDASGNLGLGVTPSAWPVGWRVLEMEYSSSGQAIAALYPLIIANAYSSGANYTYKTTAAASYYSQVNGVHRWYNAPSGTAGNAITFTQAMTLAATGNLLVGTTTDGGYKLDVNGTGRFSGMITGRLALSNSDASTENAIGLNGINTTDTTTRNLITLGTLSSTGVLFGAVGISATINNYGVGTHFQNVVSGGFGHLVTAGSGTQLVHAFSVRQNGQASGGAIGFTFLSGNNGAYRINIHNDGTYNNFRILSDAGGAIMYVRDREVTNTTFGSYTYYASAQVAIDSTTKGFLPPRMTAAQRTAISTPADGLIVYQTDGTSGLYVYNGSSWRTLAMV